MSATTHKASAANSVGPRNNLVWLIDLFSASHTTVTDENLPAVQNAILRQIVTGFDADSGCIALTDDTLFDHLMIVAGTDLPPGIEGSITRIGEGILGWVVKEGRPLLLNGQDANDDSFDTRPLAKTPRNWSTMCWPLQIEERTIGALSVRRNSDEFPFSDDDLLQGRLQVGLLGLLIENVRMHAEHRRRIQELTWMNREITTVNERLQQAQSQLMQSEKMASVGQLAAGVAHEINNPIGYVYSNLGSLGKYITALLTMLDEYARVESLLPACEATQSLHKVKKAVDLEFMREDLGNLMDESRDGITRVKKIVQDLKDFSHSGADDEWQLASIQAGLESTLNMVRNEFKYKAKVVKELTEIPAIECLPSQLNQVFMNLIVNAAQSIKEYGVITIRSGREGEDWVWLEVQDTGEGIKPEHINRIFDPFFSTKPVGKGTGLGLTVSYGIIQKHRGRIDVRSEIGKGTVFRVALPVRRQATTGERPMLGGENA